MSVRKCVGAEAGAIQTSEGLVHTEIVADGVGGSGGGSTGKGEETIDEGEALFDLRLSDSYLVHSPIVQEYLQLMVADRTSTACQSIRNV